MTLNRYGVGALVGAAALMVGGGTALAGSGEGKSGARCESRLAKIAEKRGVSVEQLQSNMKAKMLAAIDAAEKAGKITSEQAAQKRQRVSEASPCSGVLIKRTRFAGRGMIHSAAKFLELDRAALKEQLPGNSLAGLATKQGKDVAELKAAMLAPAKKRLAQAVDAEKMTQAQANERLAKLEMLVDKLAAKTFPTK
ncbi:MAG: hypothetical protein OEV29_00650 [Thermoleophilia bacterium]|nr:hypothetical protein [Thermoleophilia bacterium]MDH4340053.1 hypothetical protein [Thermoleophilia bacterium]